MFSLNIFIRDLEAEIEKFERVCAELSGTTLDTCTYYFLLNKVSGKYVSRKDFPESW